MAGCFVPCVGHVWCIKYDQGPDFQNFLRRSQEDLRKMTELTKILGKSYEKLKKILRKTYDELTKKL